MARRLDVELTSTRADGKYTWRAAGAKHPKGDLDAGLLPDGIGVGDVVRVEAEADLDGLTVTTVFAPKGPRPEAERIELISSRPTEAGVTARLVQRRGRKGPDEQARTRRRGKRSHDKQGGGRTSEGKKDPRRSPSAERKSGDAKRERRRRPERPERDERGDRRQRSEKRSRDRRRARQSAERRQAKAAGPRAPRLRAKRSHRNAALAALPEAQQELAKEVLRGGVPGVREAIDRMNSKATAEGIPKIKRRPLIALAEKMAPVLKAAEWRDKAEAAEAGLATVDLRDLRSVVSAADSGARGEEAAALADRLRAGVAERVDKEHRAWLKELAATISDGRAVRALQLSSHPPKAGSPLPVDLAARLSALASKGLTADISPSRWAMLAEAVALSPVRAQVRAEGAPAEPGKELLATMRKLAPRTPELARLFDIETPATGRPARKPEPPPPPPAAKDDETASKAQEHEPAQEDQAAPEAQAPQTEPASEDDKAAPEAGEAAEDNPATKEDAK